MKSAKIFLCGMYLHLLLSIAVPSLGIIEKDVTESLMVFVLFYIIIILSVLAVGWVSVAMAVKACKRGEYEKVKSGWRLLKYGTIPFYIINFLYSLFVWFVLLVASRGFLIAVLPLPITITCTMIFQSGCIGWCYIRYLNRQTKNDEKISKIHYVMQVISILDIISTVLVLRKENKLIGERCDH
ncbi:MAG: hypothetical protein Q4G33_03600 [bacterium]|nr:hypothetical protein [bacterium]